MTPPHELETKKQAILEVAREMAVERFTPAEIEQVRRRLVAQFGASAKTSTEYIAQVIQEAGMRVMLSTVADAECVYEEEFQDLLHFSTLKRPKCASCGSTN